MSKKSSRTGRVFRRKRKDGSFVDGWYFRVRRGDVEVTRKGGATKQAAQAAMQSVMKDVDRQLELSQQGLDHIPFEEFAEIYLDEIQMTHSPTNVPNVCNKVRNQLIPVFEGKLLFQITQPEIRRFLSKRARQGIANATYNGDLAQLSAIFRMAVEMGYASSNPVKGIKRKRPDEHPVPYLDQPSQLRLIEECDERIRPVVTLALDSGMRLSELMRLQWRDVDLDQRSVTVRESKNRQSRVIPVPSRSITLLSDLRSRRVISIRDRGLDRVFSWIPTKVREAWPGWCRRLYKNAVIAAEIAELRFHDLRHCYAVDLVRAGVPLPDVARMMGHRQMVTTWRYAKHQPQDATYRARDVLERHRLGNGSGEIRESA